ncbi:MAG: hypothetical protein JJV98_15190 [Desulfosarcina sp.]|nr:hypothetical protein [Desulfobacterales bacterium]
MRFLPFRSLLVLVVFPPVMYMLAIQGAEALLLGHYHRAIEKYVPGDTQPLLSGQATLTDMLQKNMERLSKEDPFLSRGVVLAVTVKTSQGRRIFPPVYLDPEDAVALHNPIEVASRNYALLDEGLVVDLDVKINQNTLVANVILAACLLVALSALGYLYRRGSRKLEYEEEERLHEIRRWHEFEQTQQASLTSMKADNAHLMGQIAQIQTEMQRERSIANRNEEDLFDEMAQLEQQLQDHVEQQKKQQHLITDLENQLGRMNRVKARQSAQQNRTVEAWRKRFSSLYKDTLFTDWALKGFVKLSEGLQIKAEEVIHQLNADADTVIVKRKLFQRKGRETVFEIVLARKGRLYFRRNKSRQIEVLAIGTKNDQGRDLEFLDRLGLDAGQSG